LRGKKKKKGESGDTLSASETRGKVVKSGERGKKIW